MKNIVLVIVMFYFFMSSVYAREVKCEAFNPVVLNVTTLKDSLCSYAYQNISNIYAKDNMYYVDYNGKTYGPYEDKPYVRNSNKGNNFYIEYRKGSKKFINVNGREIGPMGLHNIYFANSTKGEDFAISYNVGNDFFININGTEYGPYANVFLKAFYAIDKYAYVYEENNGNIYANINGKIYGSYDIGDYRLGKPTWTNVGLGTNGEGFAITYKKDGKYYANVNDIILGPFSYQPELIVSNQTEGGFIFNYKSKYTYCLNVNGKDVGYCEKDSSDIFDVKFSDDGSQYMYVDSYGLNYRVNVNGKIIGSFDSNERIPEIFSFHNENDYSFRHKLNSADYLNINGIEYGPYDSVWKPYGLTFGYIKNGKSYVSISGKIHGPYDSAGFISVDPTISQVGYMYENNKSWGVVVDGKDLGYISDNPIEFNLNPYGSGFYIQYIKNNKPYVNVNNKIYGPYDSLSIPNIYFMPDGKTYAISYKENGKTFVLVSDGINSANIEQTNKNINSTPEKVLITPEYSTRAISFKNRILTLIDSRSKGNKWTKNKLLEIVIKNLDSRIQKELNKANKTLLIQIKELLNKEFTQN